jgi:hypothetical protein
VRGASDARRIAAQIERFSRFCLRSLLATDTGGARVQKYVTAFAHGLHALRVRGGMSVGLFTPTEPEPFVYFLALANLGAQSVVGAQSVIHERDGGALSDALTQHKLRSFLFESVQKDHEQDMAAVGAVQTLIPELKYAPVAPLRSRRFPQLLHVIQTDRQQQGNIVCSVNIAWTSPVPDRTVEFIDATPLDAPLLASVAAAVPSFTQAELVSTAAHLAHAVGFAPTERVLVVTAPSDTVGVALQLAAFQAGATLVYSPFFEDSLAQLQEHQCTTVAAASSNIGALDLTSPAWKLVKKVIVSGGATPHSAQAVAQLEALGKQVFVIQQ